MTEAYYSGDRDTGDALRLARRLVTGGMPLFLGQPDPYAPTGFRLPYGWERAGADPAVVDAWRPGMALCAVTGVLWDVVDVDPRAGGRWDGTWMPEPYLIADTPSGGQHYFVAPLGVGSRDGVLPGLDVKSGRSDGSGRGFVFLAPTVRRSKVTGADAAYRWAWQRPPGPNDQEDVSGEALRRKIEALRVREGDRDQPRTLSRQQAAREWTRAVQRLTNDVAMHAARGWGGDAHAELLVHSTHLARLSPESAEDAWVGAFHAAGVEPDEADMLKIRTAIDRAVPDVVVDTDGLGAEDAFWLGGGDAPPPDQGQQPGGSVLVSSDHVPGVPASGELIKFFTPENLAEHRATAPPCFGAFGGTPLFYADGVHWLQGESDSGKSWVGFALVLDVVRQGHHALVVDHEDTWDGVAERLDALGATPEEKGRVGYVSGQGTSHAALSAHLDANPSAFGVVLVDGVTSALNAAGLSGKSEQELTRWVDELPRKARMSVMIDHVTKDPENRNGMAIGSQAKKAVVTGTSFEVRVVEKFGVGSNGIIELRLQKDKRGKLRGVLGKRPVRLAVQSDPVSGSVHLGVVDRAVESGGRLVVEDEQGALVTALAARLEAFPNVHPGLSLRHLLGVLKEELGVKASTETLREAVRLFKHRAGVPGVQLPEWLAAYEHRAGAVSNVVELFPGADA